MCDQCRYPDHFRESRREPTEEEIAEFVASRNPESELEILRIVVDEAKRYWDNLGEPYPEHLQSAIDFLGVWL